MGKMYFSLTIGFAERDLDRVAAAIAPVLGIALSPLSSGRWSGDHYGFVSYKPYRHFTVYRNVDEPRYQEARYFHEWRSFPVLLEYSGDLPLGEEQAILGLREIGPRLVSRLVVKRAATDQERDIVMEQYNFDQDADGSASPRR